MLALLAAAPALAQSGPQLQGYSDEAGQTQDQVNQPTSDEGGSGIGAQGQGTAPAAQTVDSGDSSLPFTGLDLGLMAAAAAGLMALGFGLRRLARAPQAS